MTRTAALLAVAIVLAAPGCGGDGDAEPGAPEGAARALTLVLDFQPNAVHTGIYVAAQRGLFDDARIELGIREPGESTDAPKLLRAGRAELAILDIHDLAIARDRGAQLIGVGAIVQRPLAAVIAADRRAVRSPADLDGARIGVTGLPSDDAVLDTVLVSGGLAPSDVERVTIGFDSIAALSAGRIDAATAFWNAEGVEMRRLGLATREFRVDRFGAPRYPELVIVTTPQLAETRRQEIGAVLAAIAAGTEAAVADPARALDDLLAAVPELDRDSQRAQLEALNAANAFEPAVELEAKSLRRFARFEAEAGITRDELEPSEAFVLGESSDRAAGAPAPNQLDRNRDE